ncbi:flavoprotein [Streptomyces sp. T12]|uniref:flavoprotein n=2 Tax=unclassified Streptomyces TaxID=2593676 RepID=UPI0023655AB0|nr:flavoprotein [Streptomyces sp. T12]WDF39836.1 flavoprotein [Streptomyces sp. T12]
MGELVGDPTAAGLPAFGARRLLYVGTGALSAAHMPFWLNWLRQGYPDVEVRPLITRSAERFVSRGALAPLAGREALLDAWPDGPVHAAPHVELAEWAEAVVVHPASLNFLARLALGLADTPVMLALQCTSAPVVLAPSLPPGALRSAAYRRHRAALEERPNVSVVPPTPGLSSTTGRMDAALAAPLPELLTAAERLRTRADDEVAR